MPNHTRHGKRIMGKHSTLIEGLDEFLKKLEEWPEVRTTKPCHLTTSRKAGRSGGLTFRATRWKTVGVIRIGIRCIATHGSSNQEVILTSDNLDALKVRLQAEGLCEEW